MKTRIGIACVLCMFCIAAFGPFKACRAANVKGAAALASLVGDVQVQSGSGAWKAAREGAVLEPGDSVRTAAGSKARLVLEDGALLVVGELSVFSLKSLDTDYSTSMSTSDFTLSSGAVRVVAEKKLTAGSAFNIETPTAVAGVRGTDFSVELDDAETTTVTVFEGQVEVGNILQSLKERVLLDPEHSTEVPRGKPPVKPMKLKKEILERKREKLAQRLKPDVDDDDAAARDQSMRITVAAHIHQMPDDQKQKLMENVRAGRISVDDAQGILSSVHRGVDKDTARMALEIATRNDIPKDKIKDIAAMIREGDTGGLRQKLEKIRDARGAPDSDTDSAVPDNEAAGSDAADSARENLSKQDLETLRADILRTMDKEKVKQALARMNPDDPARRELQVIQDAIEKGIPREKLEPLVNALRNGIINDREAVLIIEAVRRGVDPRKLETALRRLSELKADSQIRMLVLKAMALNVDMDKLMEKLKASNLTPAEIRQRLEQLIKDRLSAVDSTKPTAPDVDTPSTSGN